MSTSGAIVVVTGATGFIASHAIQQLLARGYRVHGTVRSLAKTERYSYLQAMEGAADRLRLFEADLNNADSFRECMQDADYVLHIASPYSLSVQDPQRDLVDPAVNGTVAVLEICANTPSVKRMVITASMGAVTDNFALEHPYTEADWNEDSTLTKNPYYYSKVCAEKAAYEFMRTHEGIHFDMCTINPGMVLGPHLSGGVNGSVVTIQRLLNGDLPGIPNLSFAVIDVRDAALAHILAIENPAANGRHLLCYGPVHMREMAAIMRERYPTYAVPSTNVPDFVMRIAANFEDAGTRDFLQSNLGHVARVDNSKSIQELGLTYRTLEETIVDTVDDLIKHNHVHTKSSSCIIM